MTGALSSNAPLPPLDPFSCDDNEDTYRLPQLRSSPISVLAILVGRCAIVRTHADLVEISHA